MFGRVLASFFLFLVVLGTVAARPMADDGQDGQEILRTNDSRYYGFPDFWYRRPVNEENDDSYGDDDYYGQPRPQDHGDDPPSLAIVGSGWGR